MTGNNNSNSTGTVTTAITANGSSNLEMAQSNQVIFLNTFENMFMTISQHFQMLRNKTNINF